MPACLLKLRALNMFGLSRILRTLKFNENQIQWTIALVMDRMLSPSSERQTHDWMCERSSLMDLLGGSLPSLNTLYTIAARLYRHQKTIIDELFGNTKELLGFTETMAFFDLTNTYYTGHKKDELLHYGRSKEKRRDCPLVTLAMTSDASGFPRTVETLPGNGRHCARPLNN